MNARDSIMVGTSLASMAAGVFLPDLAGPEIVPHLAPFPRLMLMLLFYLSFLAVGAGALLASIRIALPLIARMTVWRLFLVPVIMLAVFRCLFPEFALGALLLCAAPVGVMAGVFALMLGADTALVLVVNIVTSLLFPLTLPLVLAGTDAALRFIQGTGLGFDAGLSLTGLMISLAVTILIPFVLSLLTQRVPGLTDRVLRANFPLVTTAVMISNISIFSQYSGILHQSPDLLLRALLSSCVLCVLMTIAAIPFLCHLLHHARLSFLISAGVINNVLLMILSNEFFSATEALMAAAYLVPLYLMLFYYRFAGRTPNSADAR